MKKILGLFLALIMVLGFALPVGATVGYDSTLLLENKDAAWDIIPGDSIQGTLQYNKIGSTFDFNLSATGLEVNTDYSLIYYADDPVDRFTNWGGNNPGALIGTYASDDSGVLAFSGSKDLGINLPCLPDGNISVYDYSGAPDNYAHAHGAKIWVVPSADYDATDKKVTTWAPADFLFETDLIHYNRNGVVVTVTVEEQIVAINVTPSSVNYGTLVAGTTSTTQTISVTNAGNVTIAVTADVRPDGTPMEDWLKCNPDDPELLNGHVESAIAPTNTRNIETFVAVPSGASSGIVNGLVVFTATIP